MFQFKRSRRTPRGVSPLTTWHSQGGLLLISATWGLSYMTSDKDRVRFAEVFPDTITAHRGWWGLSLVICCAAAYKAERVMNKDQKPHPWAWRTGYTAHMALAGIYCALAMCALLQGFNEIHGAWHSWHLYGNIASSVSRPVLWGYIGYLHTTYARLPTPESQKHQPAGNPPRSPNQLNRRR